MRQTLFILILFWVHNFSAQAQHTEVVKDTTEIYKDVQDYTKKSKAGRLFNKLIFINKV